MAGNAASPESPRLSSFAISLSLFQSGHSRRAEGREGILLERLLLSCFPNTRSTMAQGVSITDSNG